MKREELEAKIAAIVGRSPVEWDAEGKSRNDGIRHGVLTLVNRFIAEGMGLPESWGACPTCHNGRMLPFVYVVMPTMAARRAYLPRALRCWARQDYRGPWKLLVLDGGDGGETAPDPSIVPVNDPRFEYRYLPERVTLGAKYNAGHETAPMGAWCAIAGDDDWVSPQRISYVVDAMLERDVDIAGTLSMLGFRESDSSTWLYAHPYPVEAVGPEDGDAFRVSGPYLIGGTMIYARRYWEASPYPDEPRGVDSVFIRRILQPEGGAPDVSYLPLNEPRLYVAMVHGGNTGNTHLLHSGANTVWSKMEGFDIRGFMGKDADAFLGTKEDEAEARMHGSPDVPLSTADGRSPFDPAMWCHCGITKAPGSRFCAAHSVPVPPAAAEKTP